MISWRPYLSRPPPPQQRTKRTLPGNQRSGLRFQRLDRYPAHPTAFLAILGTIESRESGFFLRKNPLSRSGFGLHLFRKCYSRKERSWDGAARPATGAVLHRCLRQPELTGTEALWTAMRCSGRVRRRWLPRQSRILGEKLRPISYRSKLICLYTKRFNTAGVVNRRRRRWLGFP